VNYRISKKTCGNIQHNVDAFELGKLLVNIQSIFRVRQRLERISTAASVTGFPNRTFSFPCNLFKTRCVWESEKEKIIQEVTYP